MRLSYENPKADTQMQEIAIKIVELLVDSNMTYQKASETLETARTLLAETKPQIK